MNAQYFFVIHDLIIQLSYHIRHQYLDTDKVEEMISITLIHWSFTLMISLIINEKTEEWYSSVSSLANKLTLYPFK